MLKRTGLRAILCLAILFMFTACNGGEPAAQTLVVRNISGYDTVLKSVVINGRAYLTEDYLLKPADQKVPVSEKDFAVTFDVEAPVTVELVLYDTRFQQEVESSQTYAGDDEISLIRALYTKGQFLMFAL